MTLLLNKNTVINSSPNCNKKNLPYTMQTYASIYIVVGEVFAYLEVVF